MAFSKEKTRNVNNSNLRISWKLVKFANSHLAFGESARSLFLFLPLMILLALLTSACLAPQVSQRETTVKVSILADGQNREVEIPSGSTVQKALDISGISLGTLDRVEPPAYTLLSAGDAIRITRVREEFSTEQKILAFERQTVRNESMPLGEERLIQPGVNGTQELTRRTVYENGVEINSAVVKIIVLQPAVPEIFMIGVQAPYAPLAIPGRLAYLAGGNAWLMEESTATRRPIITTGDLDGRIFKLSSDGEWLLFTRKSQKPPEQEINSLWVYNFTDPKAPLIDLKVRNVIHFADFDPNEALTIDYSTVEPRAAAPGWQANNNMYRRKFGKNGLAGVEQKIIEPNSGGVYGWWGTQFLWSPDGSRLAYARPDGIGIVSFKNKALIPLLETTPLQTRSDWALIPGLAWGADSRTLYLVTHAPPTGLVNAEESPYFDLSALQLDTGIDVSIVRQSGMFAYPAASPLMGSENSFQVAYLQAFDPLQSEKSGYRLFLMDRDGSNRRGLFPIEGGIGLHPQSPVWAPAPAPSNGALFLAILYQGNLYLIDTTTGEANQVTGDGLIQKIDWK